MFPYRYRSAPSDLVRGITCILSSSIAVLFSALPLIGCVDKGESDTSSGETGCVDADGDGYGEGADCTGTDCDESDATVWEDCSAAGESDLVFTLHFDARQSDWTATGCIPGAEENTIGCDDPEEQETLVIMLCATSDTTCESPVLIRAVTAEENEEGILVLYSFGADMRVSSLPAGDWLVMLMIDSAGSIGNGAAWTDDFGSIETAWGGVASTGDVLLSGGRGTTPPRSAEQRLELSEHRQVFNIPWSTTSPITRPSSTSDRWV
jgi:hypothetical protein